MGIDDFGNRYFKIELNFKLERQKGLRFISFGKILNMTPFLQYLVDKELPGYALLKNAATEFVPGKGYQIASFDEAHWALSLEELQAKIPKPVLQNTREAKEYAGYRFSTEELKEEDFHFDTTPSALLNEAGDSIVFGASYTILWVAEPNEDWMRETVVGLMNQRTQVKITSDDILAVWEATIDRVFFRSTGDDIESLVMIFDDLIQTAIDAINQLPNAPDQSDWEVLGDIDFSNDDEA